MNHDELLADIDSNISNCGDDCESCKSDNAPWVALREVVELHALDFGAPGEEEVCDYCKVTYPCATIQAIEKELR